VSPRRQQSSDLPWSLQQDASATGSTAGMDFIPEAQPNEVLADAGNVAALKKSLSAVEAGERPPGSTGGGSKKRLIFIMLIGVLLIVGAYAFNEYFLQDTTTALIEKPVPPRKSPRAAVKKPVKPATEAEPAAQTPAAETTAKAEPADVPSQDAQQQTPALEPPAPSAPKDILTEKAAEKTEQASTTVPVKKAEPIAEPVKSTQGTPTVPDKETSPAKGIYTIHVSSFKQQQYAQEQIEHLRKLGFDAYLETVDLGKKGIWHRVKAGHYVTRAEAEQAIKIIQKKHPGPTPLININR
jgi:outer membrane biosynthesis protein TonB